MEDKKKNLQHCHLIILLAPPIFLYCVFLNEKHYKMATFSSRQNVKACLPLPPVTFVSLFSAPQQCSFGDVVEPATGHSATSSVMCMMT